MLDSDDTDADRLEDWELEVVDSVEDMDTDELED